MAVAIEKITWGVDASKHHLDLYCWQDQTHQRIPNEHGAIRKWLKSQSGSVELSIESTSDFHLECVELAHQLGHTVYLVNARQLAHYRDAVGQRNKTDATDAWLLARYLVRERSELRPFRLCSAEARELWALIKRRSLVVSLRQQLRQSLAPLMSVKANLRSLNELIARIDRRIVKLIARLGWTEPYRRCQSIPGVGPLNAAALVAAFHRGDFASADAFVAYLGLDVRVRESGRFKGKRKLTKYGDPEPRRLLWCAGQAACNYPPFAEYRDRQLAKGLSKTAAKVILARKLARIAFALLRDQATFRKSPSGD